MMTFIALLSFLIPTWIFVIAVRKFVTDVRRRAHNREQANQRFQSLHGRPHRSSDGDLDNWRDRS